MKTKKDEAFADRWFKTSTNSTVDSFLGFLSIEGNSDDGYLFGLKDSKIDIIDVFYPTTGGPIESNETSDIFSRGIIASNCDYDFIENIKIFTPDGHVSKSYVRSELIPEMPRLIPNKRNG